jgi:hypothetical protein
MTAPIIGLYAGEVPSRNQPAGEFADNADSWLGYQAPLAASYNALASYLDALAVSTTADLTSLVSQGEVSRDDAENFSIASEASSVVAQSASNMKGRWSDLTGALSVPASVENGGSLWVLLVDLPNVASSEPTSFNSDWLDMGGTFAQKSYTDRASGVIVREAVNTYLYLQEAANKTYTLDASTFPSGYIIYIGRMLDSSGFITVITDEGVILLPDGTSNGTQDLQKRGIIALVKTASGWTARVGG